MERLRDLAAASALSLRRHPLHAVAIVLFLSLGVGTHALSFAAVYACFWRPLPFSQADRLVVLGENQGSRYSQPLHYSRFLEWRSSADVFEDMSANSYAQVYIAAEETSDVVPVEYVSAGFFRILRVPLMGREFVPAEDRQTSERAVMISNELWARMFGSDQSLIGRSIRVNGHPFTLVGIVPAGFRFWRHAEVYLPVGLREGGASCQSCGNLYVVGRLRPGVELWDAQVHMNHLQARLGGPFLQSSVAVRPYREFVTARLRPLGLLMFVATGLLLVVACVHVVNLLRARRAAPRLSHTLIASGTAGLLGFLFCAVGCRVLSREIDDTAWLPIGGFSADGAVLVYSLSVAVIVGLVVMLFAALAVRRCRLDIVADTAARLPDGAPRPLILTRALLIVQIALGVAITFGAGGRARSYCSLLRADPGFDASHVLTLHIRQLPQEGSLAPGDGRDIAARVIEEVWTLPGVVSVASMRELPTEPLPRIRATIVGQARQRHFDAAVQQTSPAFLEALGLSIVRGRWFAPHEDRHAVIAVNEIAATQYWQRQDPLGTSLSLQPGSDTASLAPRSYSVIGVVKDTRRLLPRHEAVPQLYLPETTLGALAVRTVGDPSAMAAFVRRRIAAVDRNLAVYDVSSLARLETRARRHPRVILAAMLALALLSAIFTAAGFYGATAVMMAVRGRPWTHPARRMLQPLTLALTGVSAGTTAAALLPGVTWTDWPTLAWAAAAPTVTAVVASAAAMYVESRSAAVSAPPRKPEAACQSASA